MNQQTPQPSIDAYAAGCAYPIRPDQTDRQVSSPRKSQQARVAGQPEATAEAVVTSDGLCVAGWVGRGCLDWTQGEVLQERG